VSRTRVCSTNHQELRRLYLPELALWRWSFSANIWFLLLLSILPKFTVETQRDYQTFPFISILSTYPNLQESTLSSSPCPPFRNLQEILEGALPGRREHCQAGRSEQIVSSYPQKCRLQRWGIRVVRPTYRRPRTRRFRKIVERPEFFDVDPPDVLVLSLRSESPNYPNLSRDEPTQIPSI
jgi:hypothetical protein